MHDHDTDPDRRWEICALVHEAPSLVLPWVAYHLALGADRIRMFFDKPIPEVSDVLAGHPRVRITLCDEAFWARHPGGPRPSRIGQRQRVLLQQVVDRARPGWVFHIDVDEMLVTERPIAEVLAALGPGVEHAGTRAEERVYLGPPDPGDIFCGVFRAQPVRRHVAEVARADGPVAAFLQKGMTGYVGGKSAFRAGSGLSVGVHGPKPLKPETGADLAGVGLLHFDGLTPAHWVRKRVRLLRQQPNARLNETDHRRRQLAHMETILEDPAALHDFYLSLKQLDPARAAALDGLGLLRRHRFDPRPAMAAELPGVALDLGAAAFDAFAIV